MSKQRIVFVNIHADWMLMKVAMVYIFKYSAAIKHGYFLKYLLEHPEEYEVCSYLNDRSFSLYTKGGSLFQRIINIFSPFEHWLTLHKNNIKQSSIKVIRDINQIKDDDIVIMYNVAEETLRGMGGVHAFKALSMLHFHGREAEDKIIEDAKIDCFFNEVNLSETSAIFQKYYHTIRPWIIHPFVFAERFKSIKPFNQRQNKCFSTGTITYKTHPEFLSVYTDPCDQPARKFVKDNPDFFAATVDCFSSDYLEDNPGKKIYPSDNIIVKIYKGLYNRTHVGKQKKYFSFNMVEKFNDYKMCLIGEEILGVPGIGFVEGMACGCAYIGLDSPMYKNLGLIPGIHYIPYDGTKEGLRQVIEYYQMSEHQEELEKIAQAGNQYVLQNFNGNTVAKNLIHELIKLRDKTRKKCKRPSTE